ncbi:hypothetical protein NQ318_007590 [Aromia moschata]|uniref:Uncharacterized protein n=1 Tax=Aromia moschata TaxID=1265417 RepID=A0AAV8YDQ7_9CUCU|nr:hypothetical protein NQ318_007590 [Aromia moschata]
MGQSDSVTSGNISVYNWKDPRSFELRPEILNLGSAKEIFEKFDNIVSSRETEGIFEQILERTIKSKSNVGEVS